MKHLPDKLFCEAVEEMRDLLAKQRSGRTRNEEKQPKTNPKVSEHSCENGNMQLESGKGPEQSTDQLLEIVETISRGDTDAESDSDEGILPILPSNLPPEKAFAMIGKFYKWFDIEELKERYHNKKCEGMFTRRYGQYFCFYKSWPIDVNH